MTKLLKDQEYLCTTRDKEGKCKFDAHKLGDIFEREAAKLGYRLKKGSLITAQSGVTAIVPQEDIPFDKINKIMGKIADKGDALVYLSLNCDFFGEEIARQDDAPQIIYRERILGAAPGWSR